MFCCLPSEHAEGVAAAEETLRGGVVNLVVVVSQEGNHRCSTLGKLL